MCCNLDLIKGEEIKLTRKAKRVVSSLSIREILDASYTLYYQNEELREANESSLQKSGYKKFEFPSHEGDDTFNLGSALGISNKIILFPSDKKKKREEKEREEMKVKPYLLRSFSNHSPLSFHSSQPLSSNLISHSPNISHPPLSPIPLSSPVLSNNPSIPNSRDSHLSTAPQAIEPFQKSYPKPVSIEEIGLSAASRMLMKQMVPKVRKKEKAKEIEQHRESNSHSGYSHFDSLPSSSSQELTKSCPQQYEETDAVENELELNDNSFLKHQNNNNLNNNLSNTTFSTQPLAFNLPSTHYSSTQNDDGICFDACDNSDTSNNKRYNFEADKVLDDTYTSERIVQKNNHTNNNYSHRETNKENIPQYNNHKTNIQNDYKAVVDADNYSGSVSKNESNNKDKEMIEFIQDSEFSSAPIFLRAQISKELLNDVIERINQFFANSPGTDSISEHHFKHDFELGNKSTPLIMFL
eukprot:CAMPEP_0174259498 /NCGR_PEP_ID=MMETSP0439-20130205/8312_1 /TAXON_ID=0 /ORGANISM="Stereomyxa ramosa, Strain Chinc5" /LENGTH=468 /DNA_ID=CAMNT_0015343401 /DNA_START=1 /DNA_END=1403 /DNA_ORIENTATION=+